MRRINKISSLRYAVAIGAAMVGANAVFSYDTQSPISYWPVGDVEWNFNLVADPPNIPNVSGGSPLMDGSTSWDDAVGVAIDAYNAIIPDSVLTLTANKNSGVTAGSADDVNNVSFSDTVYGNAWGGSTLGISISRWSGNGRIENDVLFNSTKSWNAYTGNLQGGLNDIRRVAIHEFGHSLGLDHPDQATPPQVVSAIMNSTSSNVDALAQDDIDGILSLYGAIIPLAITYPPQSVSVVQNTNAPFQVGVKGSETITYQWQFSDNGTTWTNVGGATFNPISFTNMQLANSGRQFRVMVTDYTGGTTLTSGAATLTVTAGPVDLAVAAQPQDDTVDEGEDASFFFDLTGSPSPTYQWEYSTDGGTTWQDMAEFDTGTGTTIATLTIPAASADWDGYQFRCTATQTGTPDMVETSDAVTLTVNTGSVPNPPPQPSSANAYSGGFTVNWTAVANATGYYLEVATDAGFTSRLSGFDPLDAQNVLTFGLSGLQPGTYYYRVSAYNGLGTSSPSASGMISVVASRFSSLSTRGQTASGDGVLIIGFTINTPSPKQLLIRSAGPRLQVAPFDILAAIDDPRLVLNRFQGPVIPPGNDDWDDADLDLEIARQDVHAFSYSLGSKDSAYLVTLDSGTYTAAAETVTAAAGVTIVELYELDEVGEFTAISSRAFVGSGDFVLIPGVGLGGGTSRLLVRAIGHTLSLDPFNVSGVLDDPVLSVFPFGEESPVAINDDWEEDGVEAAAQIAAVSSSVHAFGLPSGSTDAVVLIDLASGPFTFVVSGKNGATGIVLLELYKVP